MLMAVMLSSVRTGRCFRFSTTSLLINLLVGYDYALRQWRKLPHFAAREAGAAEHPVVFGERVRVPLRGPAKHHHAEHRVRGRRDTAFVGDELQRHGPAAGRERR